MELEKILLYLYIEAPTNYYGSSCLKHLHHWLCAVTEAKLRITQIYSDLVKLQKICVTSYVHYIFMP